MAGKNRPPRTTVSAYDKELIATYDPPFSTRLLFEAMVPGGAKFGFKAAVSVTEGEIKAMRYACKGDPLSHSEEFLEQQQAASERIGYELATTDIRTLRLKTFERILNAL